MADVDSDTLFKWKGEIEKNVSQRMDDKFDTVYVKLEGHKESLDSGFDTISKSMETCVSGMTVIDAKLTEHVKDDVVQFEAVKSRLKVVWVVGSIALVLAGYVVVGAVNDFFESRRAEASHIHTQKATE